MIVPQTHGRGLGRCKPNESPCDDAGQMDKETGCKGLLQNIFRRLEITSTLTVPELLKEPFHAKIKGFIILAH